MRNGLVRKIAGYVFAIAIIVAGWQLTALAVDNPVLPGPSTPFPWWERISPTCGPRCS